MKYTFLYIDPSSGTYLLQVMIAAVLGGLMYFKNGWLKIKSFFVKQKPVEETEEKEEVENENHQ